MGAALWCAAEPAVCMTIRLLCFLEKPNQHQRRTAHPKQDSMFVCIFSQKLLAAKNLNLERLPFRDAYLFQYGLLPDQCKPPRCMPSAPEHSAVTLMYCTKGARVPMSQGSVELALKRRQVGCFAKSTCSKIKAYYCSASWLTAAFVREDRIVLL